MKKTKTILSYGGVLILGIMLGQCSGVEPTESPQVAASEPAAPSQAAAPISRLPAQPVAIPPQPAARAGRAIPSEDYVKTFPSRAELRQEIEDYVINPCYDMLIDDNEELTDMIDSLTLSRADALASMKLLAPPDLEEMTEVTMPLIEGLSTEEGSDLASRRTLYTILASLCVSAARQAQ